MDKISDTDLELESSLTEGGGTGGQNLSYGFGTRKKKKVILLTDVRDSSQLMRYFEDMHTVFLSVTTKWQVISLSNCHFELLEYLRVDLATYW